MIRAASFVAVMLLCSCAGWCAAADGEEKLPFPLPKSPAELPRSAVIETTKGPIEIRFLGDLAPVTVKNFEYLARRGFYNGTAFHDVEPGFAVQGGSPHGDGKGGPGYTLPAEFSSYKHIEGTMGMLRYPSRVNPERRSNGSQFYITLRRATHLDGLYTVFAQVVSGINIVGQLEKGDKIVRVVFGGEQ